MLRRYFSLSTQKSAVCESAYAPKKVTRDAAKRATPAPTMQRHAAHATARAARRSRGADARRTSAGAAMVQTSEHAAAPPKRRPTSGDERAKASMAYGVTSASNEANGSVSPIWTPPSATSAQTPGAAAAGVGTAVGATRTSAALDATAVASSAHVAATVAKRSAPSSAPSAPGARTASSSSSIEKRSAPSSGPLQKPSVVAPLSAAVARARAASPPPRCDTQPRQTVLDEAAMPRSTRDVHSIPVVAAVAYTTLPTMRTACWTRSVARMPKRAAARPASGAVAAFDSGKSATITPSSEAVPAVGAMIPESRSANGASDGKQAE